jgi:hypothetical protein
MQAHKNVSKGKDVMLIGGARDMPWYNTGYIRFEAGLRDGRKVIIVDPFDGDTCLDCVLALKEILGERLVGVVLNRVPMKDGLPARPGVTIPWKARDSAPWTAALGQAPGLHHYKTVERRIGGMCSAARTAWRNLSRTFLSGPWTLTAP